MEFPVCLHVNVIKGVFTASTTVAPVKKKGKIPVQEEKTPESPKQQSKFTRVPKGKEPEPEVIKLKKVPVKPQESEKQVVTHKAEVTRCCDPDLTVHGLHNREDREITTLGRTERIFTAEEETIPLSYFKEAERVVDVEKTEKDGWTRTPKAKKEDKPEVLNVEKKKITKLPKEDEQKESVKLKPFKKSGKPEEEPQKIKLKKVPTKPKEPEKEVITHKVEVTRHYDTELTVQKLHHREDREVKTAVRPERVFTAAQEASELGHMDEPEKLQAEDEKSRWIRNHKTPKEEEPEPDLTKMKIKILPKKEEEQEVVTLKPFEKPQKSDTDEPPKTKKETETKTEPEHTPFKRPEMPLRDQPTTAIKHRKDEDQQEFLQRPKVDQVPKDEEPTAADKRIISTPDNEKEHVVLKPFTKVSKPEEKPEKASEEEKKKPVDTKVPTQIPSDEAPKGLKEPQLRKDEMTETSKKGEREEPAVPPKKPSPSGKKEAEKKIPQKQTEALKKGIKLKKTPSPRVVKDKVEEEKSLRPVEQLKKVELKKTPTPKDDKPKLENVPIEKKQSAEKVKPKPVSPKDSIEAVTLKKVPKKPSTEEASGPEEPGKKRVPLVKEVSPGAVQMKKVPTQPEEEVLEEETEEIYGDEEEEAWGWELVPPEDWEGEGVDGAVETPGTPGSKRGEVKAARLLI